MTKDIQERRKNAEVEISKLSEEIEKMNKMIKESKEKALDKET
jgi:chromosome segregation ATPase